MIYIKVAKLIIIAYDVVLHFVTTTPHEETIFLKTLSMAVFTLETDYPSETDSLSSKSVKIDGKTDGQSQADCPSKIKTVPFSNFEDVFILICLTRIIQLITRTQTDSPSLV